MNNGGLKRKLTIAGTLLGIFGLIAAVFFLMRYINRKPLIDISSVDWVNKTVIYKMSAGGALKAGTAKLGESGTGSGSGYSLIMDSKGDTMTFRIDKKGNTVMTKTIDFNKKQFLNEKTDAGSLTSGVFTLAAIIWLIKNKKGFWWYIGLFLLVSPIAFGIGYALGKEDPNEIALMKQQQLESTKKNALEAQRQQKCKDLGGVYSAGQCRKVNSKGEWEVINLGFSTLRS